jgi:hypothetical protein
MNKEERDRKDEKKKTEIDFTWFVGQGLYLLQMLVAQERPLLLIIELRRISERGIH